jgi:hypothetical protein
MGASTDITPTASANLVSAGMIDPNARVTRNNSVTFTGNLTPGGTITFADAANKLAPVTTRADGSGVYKAVVALSPGSNTFNVATHDAFGQSITGSLQPITYDTATPITSAVQAAIVNQIGGSAVTVKSS